MINRNNRVDRLLGQVGLFARGLSISLQMFIPFSAQAVQAAIETPAGQAVINGVREAGARVNDLVDVDPEIKAHVVNQAMQTAENVLEGVDRAEGSIQNALIHARETTSTVVRNFSSIFSSDSTQVNTVPTEIELQQLQI